MRESKPGAEPINQMLQILARARINSNKRPIYDSLRSHQASWRNQTKQKGDMVKIQTMAGFVLLLDMLDAEYDAARVGLPRN